MHLQDRVQCPMSKCPVVWAVAQVKPEKRLQNYSHTAATTLLYVLKIAFVVALCETIFCDRFFNTVFETASSY